VLAVTDFTDTARNLLTRIKSAMPRASFLSVLLRNPFFERCRGMRCVNDDYGQLGFEQPARDQAELMPTSKLIRSIW
jgi:hypothetical protein